jgi:xyloglucan-specific exo-beta-1,4-glucanase
MYKNNTVRVSILLLCVVMIISYLTFLSSSGAQENVDSEEYDWGRAKIVGGGFIPGIIFNETEKDLIYTRTDIGGAYRWEPETNTWTQLMDFVSFDEWNLSGVESIATDPVDPNRVYVAAGTYTNDWTDMNGAILRSQDRGETWERTDLPFKLGGNMPGRSMGERLAIDPNDNSIIYFGARSGNGLWRSTDYGENWSKVESFPITGNYSTNDNPDDPIGVVWVAFDKSTGTLGNVTQTIYVGVADTETAIFRSTDGGISWEALPGQPEEGYLPHKGILASNGHLFISYNEHAGPYEGGQGGSVWKYNTHTEEWIDISPEAGLPYGGLAVDAQNPDIVMVATMNLWWPDEQIYRSTDGGLTWNQFWTLDYSQEPLPRHNHFTIDYSLAPWLDWGRKDLPTDERTGAEVRPKLGWMIGDLNIDPFNSDRMMYGTGATLYGSNNLTALDREETVVISVMADGIEETAILGLISPPSGAPLLSAIGDIGGFRHEDLSVAPEMITNPYFGNSTDIDYAEHDPNIVVRVGNSSGNDPRMGVSTDNGITWFPAENAWDEEEGDSTSGGWVAVGADGDTILWSPERRGSEQDRPVSFSRDLGQSWTASVGIPEGAVISSDRVNPNKFYGLKDGVFYISTDGGATFSASSAAGLPTVITSKFKAVPDQEGHIWIAAARDNTENDSSNGLWRSTDSGQTFTKLVNVEEAATIGLGKAAPGKEYMSLYSYARINGIMGIFRSDDEGSTWIRINDDQHQFASANRTITGDPRIFGRVYMGTNGYGIVIGDIANPSDPDNPNEPSTPHEKLLADKAALEIGFAQGDHATSVTKDITLVTNGTYGSTISWKSSDEKMISTKGKVKRPPASREDKTVILTATLSIGEESVTKDFELTVKARPRGKSGK